MNDKSTESDSDLTPESTPSAEARQPQAWGPIRKVVLVLVLAMLIPIVPFLLAGPWMEERIEQWVHWMQTPLAIAWMGALALAIDLFLPVPSSAVMTYLGARCGIGLGTLAGFLGLSAGCVMGYELSRWLGPRILARYSTPADAAGMQALVARWGVLATVVSRPLPVLGETGVLVMGALSMQRLPFYTAASLANLLIAAVYAVFGWLGRETETLPGILGLSLLVPVLLMLFARRWLKSQHSQPDSP